MNGHIKIDGRPYLLRNPQSYRRYPANQMAPKMGQGQSQYRDLTSWEAWISDNWAAGIGQKAEDEGFMYGEVDSRAPNQIVLPPRLDLSDGRIEAGSITDVRYMPQSITNLLTVGTPSVERVSVLINASSSYSLTAFWFYAQTQVNITVELYAVDGNDLPTGSAIDSGTIQTVSDDYAFRWYKAAITETLSGKYAIVLKPSNTGNTFVLGGGAAYTNAVTGLYSGGAWAASVSYYPAFMSDVHRLNSGASVNAMMSYNGFAYMGAGNQLYKYSPSNDNWTTVGSARGATITDLEGSGSALYVGLGQTTNYDTMNSSEVFTGGGSPGYLFYNAGTYLWKAVYNSVYYMGAAGTWSSAIPVGKAGYNAMGISEADGDTYVATQDGLFLIAPGDIAIGITPWGGTDSASGKDMLTHHGVLHVPVAGQYLQINGGSVRNIWTIRKDELPSWASGRVSSHCTMINWPIVAVTPDSSNGFATVWAWQDLGWHFIAALPQGINPTTLFYDRARQRLWIGGSNGMVFHVYVSNYLINPVEDTGYKFQSHGWFETDWFSAGILESDKDIESLYIRGRGITDSQTVDVYWKDAAGSESIYLVDENGDSVGDESGNVLGETVERWSYFGKYETEREEKRWSITGIRPNTREIKLGFLLTSNSAAATPRIEGWRLKYHIMIMDWYGWDLPISISGKDNSPQQLVDGTEQIYTGEQQIAHLDSLSVGYVPPFLYTDIDGKVYEVKVKMASFSPEKVEWFGSKLRYDGVYTLQLEAVTSGTHSG